MSNVRAKVTADSSSFQREMKKAVLSMKEMNSEASLAVTKAKLFGSAQDTLKTKIGTLKAQIEKQTEIVKLNQAQHDKLNGALKNQQERQANLAGQISKTKKALEESAAATGEDSDETKALKEQLEKLTKEQKTVAGQIERTEAQISKQEIATNKSKESLVKLQGELEETNKKLKGVRWDEFSKGATTAADVMESVGTKLTVVSTAIAGIGVAAVKTTADFDSQMSTVKSISGATAADFGALRDKAMEMGAKTKFSASEAGAAMEYMAMAGWSTEDMLDGISGVMAAAAASGEDLALTSDILTDGLTAFGLTAKDSAHFADVLVKTGNAANTNVAMMGETFKYAGAVCGTLGISIEDCAVATGLMGNAGIKASNAGTALRAGLTNLVKPTKQAAKAMAQYGIEVQTTDDGSVDFMATMKHLRNRLGQLDSTTQAAAIASIFGKEAMSGWAAIVNASEGDFQSLTDAIYDCEGAAQEAADVKLDNLSGQITILKSTIEGIAIQIGDILMPAVREIVAKIQEWATRFSEADEKTKKMVLTIGGIVAAIGPALLVGTKVLKTIVSVHETVTKLAPVLGKMKAAILGISAPVVAVAAVVAVLIAAFKHLWDTNEGLREAITSIWAEIKETVGGFIEGVQERLAGLGIKFEDVSATIRAVWDGLCDFLAPVFKGSFKVVSTVIKTATDTILGILDVFISIFKGDWSGAWEAVKGIFSSVWEGIKEYFQTIMDTLKGIADVVLGWFRTNWETVWTSISTFFTETWTSISTFFTGIWETIKTTVSNAWETVKNVVTVGIMAVVELIHAAFELITLPFRFIWENCKETIMAAWEYVKTTVTTAITAVKDTITTVFTAVWEWITGIWNTITETTTTAWNAIKSAVEVPINEAKAAVTTVTTAVRDWISTTWDSIKTKTTNTWAAIKAAIKGPIESARTTVSNTVNTVKTTVSGIWDSIKSKTTNTWAAIKAAIKGPIESARTTVKDAIDKIRGYFNFDWSLPHLKLPHPSFSGHFGLDPPSVPHFDVAWYKNGGIMTNPTIFGASGGTALVGGEAGAEAILPLAPFYSQLAMMLDKKMANVIAATKNIHVTVIVENQLDGEDLSAKVSSKVSEKLADEANQDR